MKNYCILKAIQEIATGCFKTLDPLSVTLIPTFMHTPDASMDLLHNSVFRILWKQFVHFSLFRLPQIPIHDYLGADLVVLI